MPVPSLARVTPFADREIERRHGKAVPTAPPPCPAPAAWRLHSCNVRHPDANRTIMVEQRSAQHSEERHRNGVEEMDCDPHEALKIVSTENRCQDPNFQLAEGSGQCGCVSESRGRKRGREAEEEESSKVVEKRGCEEGMSWWTCLMLGISQERTQPQVVKKVYKN